MNELQATTPIRTSPTISELAKALVKAQSEFLPAKKSGLNPHFKAAFSTFTDLWDSVKDGLKKNNLGVFQPTAWIDGQLAVVTRVLHASGEWMEADFPIISARPDAQALGSGETYAQRYGLKAILSIPTDETDDDGEAAVGRTLSHQNTQLRGANQAIDGKTGHSNWKPDPNIKVLPILTEPQIKRLFAIAHKCGWTKDDIDAYLRKLGIESTKDLNTLQYQTLCETMPKYPKNGAVV